MGYVIYKSNHGYEPRKGLEGPFEYSNGRVLYYDPKEGKYWDPKTDFYVDHKEVFQLQNLPYKKMTEM